MKLMLTSFGIVEKPSARDSRDVDYSTALHTEPIRYVRSKDESDLAPLFDKMPPVSFRMISDLFMPDYELLVLCDQIVMDGESFESLTNWPTLPYRGVAETFRALRADGRIELVDFRSIIASNSALLDKMLEHDMKVIDQWVTPLRDSLEMWQAFVESMVALFKTKSAACEPISWEERDLLYNQLHGANNDSLPYFRLVFEALHSSELRRRKSHRESLRRALRDFLSYVNANLVISNEIGLPFHDWDDFRPFYSAKFLSVGKNEGEIEQARQQLERLFTVPFPELAIQSTSALMKVVNDKRIEDLRALIAGAMAGKVTFDEHFAKSVLLEVMEGEHKVTRFRNILGYATMPLGFIPVLGTPIQKVVEETVAFPVAKKMTQKHKWYYMLSEVAKSEES